MSKRSLRRHHLDRMKAKARHVAMFSWGYTASNSRAPEMLNRAGKWANNLAMCSGFCCGNPRKWFKYKTRQEQKADISAEEQIYGTRQKGGTD